MSPEDRSPTPGRPTSPATGTAAAAAASAAAPSEAAPTTANSGDKDKTIQLECGVSFLWMRQPVQLKAVTIAIDLSALLEWIRVHKSTRTFTCPVSGSLIDISDVKPYPGLQEKIHTYARNNLENQDPEIRIDCKAYLRKSSVEDVYYVQLKALQADAAKATADAAPTADNIAKAAEAEAEAKAAAESAIAAAEAEAHAASPIAAVAAAAEAEAKAAAAIAAVGATSDAAVAAPFRGAEEVNPPLPPTPGQRSLFREHSEDGGGGRVVIDDLGYDSSDDEEDDRRRVRKNSCCSRFTRLLNFKK